MASWWRPLLIVVVLAATTDVAAFDVEGGAPKPALRPQVPGAPQAAGDQMPPAMRPGGISGQIGNAKAEFSKWYRMYQGFVAGAAKVSQLISFICGVWLVISAPLSIIGAVITIVLARGLIISVLRPFLTLLVAMSCALALATIDVVPEVTPPMVNARRQHPSELALEDGQSEVVTEAQLSGALGEANGHH